MEKSNTAALRCSHCGDPCANDRIALGESYFCCDGCRLVYQLLDRKGLCTYYQLNAHPGVPQRTPVRKDKFGFLDQEKMAAALVTFRNGEETHATFYLPAIHCSSCLALSEKVFLNLMAGGIRIQLPSEMNNKSVRGSIQFYCPSDASRDRDLPLSIGSGGRADIAIANLLPGHYTVKISWTAGGVGYFVEQPFLVP
jgi:hypothetical protein